LTQQPSPRRNSLATSCIVTRRGEIGRAEGQFCGHDGQQAVALCCEPPALMHLPSAASSRAPGLRSRTIRAEREAPRGYRDIHPGSGKGRIRLGRRPAGAASRCRGRVLLRAWLVSASDDRRPPLRRGRGPVRHLAGRPERHGRARHLRARPDGQYRTRPSAATAPALKRRLRQLLTRILLREAKRLAASPR
jgi:hypothetical protein